MDYEIISTGSQGNAVVLDGNILIDCGVPWSWLGERHKDIKLVLLTHIHGDHFQPATIRRLAQEHPLLRFACCPWLGPALERARVPLRQIDILPPRRWYDLGICAVCAEETPHNVPNCCWHILTPHGKAFYATDMCNLHGIHARDYDLYMVEANYIYEDIKAKIAEKKGTGEYIYERRVLRDHMSKQHADDWLYANMGANSTYVYMHCHRDEAEK